jgi:hypothetical protein
VGRWSCWVSKSARKIVQRLLRTDIPLPRLLLIESAEIITIKVNGHTFSVHKALLTHFSLYFRAAFNGGFKEAAQDTVDIPDFSHYVVGLLLRFCYTGQLDADTIADSDLIKLYLLADQYDFPAIRRASIKRIADDQNHDDEAADITCPDFQDVNLAFENLHPFAPLCNFFVNYFSHHWVSEWYPSADSNWRQQFQDVSPMFLQRLLVHQSYKIANFKVNPEDGICNCRVIEEYFSREGTCK